MTRPTREMTSRRLLLALAVLGAGWQLAAGCGGQARPGRGTPAMTGMGGGGIPGLTGPVFDLVARAGHVSTPDGDSIYSWGFAEPARLMQYPGPTLIVNQGDEVTINLANELPVATSIVFPGHRATPVAGTGVPGRLTQEAPAGGSVSYKFRATHAGTYLYHSGTRPDLQVEMGLVGAIIVRPYLGAGYAYNHAATRFDRETLFLFTEMDPKVHHAAEDGDFDFDFSGYWPIYWFINGRAAPDTMLDSFTDWLPHQPYSCLPRMHPGEKLLMRVIGGGRDLHPFHFHGNHAQVIAVDGRLLESQPGKGPDLAHYLFTIQSQPGETVDAIFEWTGKNLGWDIYGDPAENGHTCVDSNGDQQDDKTAEYCPDHGKKFPVELPHGQEVTFGSHWPGTPFLGSGDLLPPGEGGLNPSGAFTFMWHSHTEKEMTNGNIFPGGLMTMLFIEPPGAAIE